MKKTVLFTIAIAVGIGLFFVFIIHLFMKKELIVSSVISEFRDWRGYNENSPEMYDRLIEYWHSCGWTWISKLNIATNASKYAWSSAFITYIMRQQYPFFPKSASHSHYVIWARNRRQQNETSFIAYQPSEYKPQPGDIIVQNRGSFSGNLNAVYEGATLHGDIVVSNTGGQIVAIGGNVSDTVTKSTYNAQNGYLTGANFIAVIKV